MGVKFNSSGGGSVTLDAPSTASNLTVTLPSASGTLVSTGSPFSGGTANGVVYLNGSSVPTTGSALTFDGTNFALGAGGDIRAYNTANTRYGRFATIADGTIVESFNGSNEPLILSAPQAGANVLFKIGGSEQMRLTSTGLGIGTTPTQTLDVNGNVIFRIASATTSRTLGFVTSNGVDGWSIGNGVTASANQFVIYSNTAGAARMLIDSSGNVGIGTSSPGKKLDVVGIVRATNSGAAAQVNVESPSGYSNFVYWRETGVADRGVIGFSNGSGNMQVRTNGAYDLSTGTLSSTINQYGVGLGTAVPSSGVGLSFPATQSASSDANTLDDYEEGTWTPTITASGGGSVGSYSSQVGVYVKIGGWVYFQMYIMFSKGTLSGDIRVSSLPFTTKNTVSLYQTTPVGYWSGLATAIVNMVSYIDPNATQFVIRKNTAAAVNTNASLAATDLGGGVNEFMFSGMYPVN